MICKKCKNEVGKKEKFCKSCGGKIKKPIYQKVWFWVIIVIFGIGAIGSSSGDNVAPTDKTTIANKPEEKAVVKNTEPKKVEEPIVEPVPEPVVETFINTAESVEIFSGDFEVGTDVKAGRYSITCDSGSGNFFVYNGEMPYINEILTTSIDDTLGMGVTRIEVDLTDGQILQVSGINNVQLEPAKIEQKTSLVAGYHLIGRDVPEGSYIATAPKGSGNFFVFDKNGFPKTNEILGKDDYGMAVEKVKVSLKKGDVIQISGLELVELN